MKRVLCVWLPYFPLQRLYVERPETKSAACVLYVESGNRAHVTIASQAARQDGIHAGLSLAEAQALRDAALFLPHDFAADLRELQTLAELAYRYSPLVGLDLSDSAHCLMLDVSGCGHLFGDDSGLARKLVIDLAERGYFAHVAVANTIGAAWAIARYGHGSGSDRRLRSLPVEALRIPDRIQTRLREFDLRTIGQLNTLPSQSLPSRFGALLIERLEQLYGRREELLVPAPRPEPVAAEWTTDEPIGHPAAIRHVYSELLAEILATLKSRNEGLLGLRLTLQSDEADVAVLEFGLARPVDSLPHIQNLIQLKLERTELPERIQTIRLEASAIATLQVRQQGLFAEQDPTGNDGSIRRLIDRLKARLGNDAVVRPELLSEAIPEQAVDHSPFIEQSRTTQPIIALSNASARPLILLPQPEPVRVSTTTPNCTLVRFHWNRRDYRIVRCTPCERIATAWWQDTGSIHRDYYQAETQTGARYWLFRDRTDHWFLHGVFE